MADGVSDFTSDTAAGGRLMDPPCARLVIARYEDARARGLDHAAALREAAGLLWTLRPALPLPLTRETAAAIVATSKG
jgi:hypothetical protein